jgi:hypothetical protein
VTSEQANKALHQASASVGPTMHDHERRTLIRRLGELMSGVSESCYYAAWLMGTEFCVPELCRRAVATGEPQPWGHGVITPGQAAELAALATELGHWATLDDDGIGYVRHDPFPIPEKYVAALRGESRS